ncbi:MAG: DNA recombination protein RmuC [Pseudomonadota bacterium]|nr:DNA recombination protein RmuC [Pseudomonadota bacterium]
MTETASLSVLLALVALIGALLGAWLGARLFAAKRDDSPLIDSLRTLLANQERTERTLREEATHSRHEQSALAAAQRNELGERIQQFQQQFGAQLAEHQRQFSEEARAGRSEQLAGLNAFREEQVLRAKELRDGVETSLTTLRTENADKLEQMRRTVDEKLHETLEKRLGESFKHVSDRLEQVHKGLGEMQALATGVGDLKKVLSNVKSRGGWGEVQLEALLEQTLTIEQFSKQVTTKPGSRETVDCAIRLPGRGDSDSPVWLPIDAKFPIEDYERLIDAQERADLDAIKAHGAQLERAVRLQAKSISEKYIAPPNTTDFAVMFLPNEGLYAEIIRRPGLVDSLQREQHIVIAGPTTLTALLNSLQMGFRTLAIEKRSSEVWQVLGAVKTEFSKFGDVLDKVRKKLDEATNQLDATGVRTRAITRQLKSVQELPGTEAERLLGAVDPVEADEE